MCKVSCAILELYGICFDSILSYMHARMHESTEIGWIGQIGMEIQHCLAHSLVAARCITHPLTVSICAQVNNGVAAAAVVAQAVVNENYGRYCL